MGEFSNRRVCKSRSASGHHQENWIEINAEKAAELPVCEEQMEPLPGAEERKAALGF